MSSLATPRAADAEMRALIDAVMPAIEGDVGADPIVAVGGRTQLDVGDPVDERCREVSAPAGVVAHEPAEMTVRVRAGTTLAELDDALAATGQHARLEADDPERATVGGVLAVGRSGLHRLGWGPVRDSVLEATVVLADGRLTTVGGPTVKNVSGYDLPRLFVGSLGTLVIFAEVVLRTRPRPERSTWLVGEADPMEVRAGLWSPSSVLWDGTQTWVCLEGLGVDVEDGVRQAGALGLVETDGPPDIPRGGRWSVPAGTVVGWARDHGDDVGRFVAEVGVGLIHTEGPAPERAPTGRIVEVQRALKERFDPAGRLAPGRLAWL